MAGPLFNVMRVDASLELLHGVAAKTFSLQAEVPPDHPSTPILGESRQGSGVLVGDSGLILTVHYVVLGAQTVTACDTEGNTFSGGVVAQDFTTGLAVVALDQAQGLPGPIRRGTSRKLVPGLDVMAMASVGGAERRVGWGVVSSLDSLDAYWEYRLERAIAITCINPGLGGGPLCTADGRLVGICSLNLGVLGRATMVIPAEYYFDCEDELLQHGCRISRPKRAWLGIFCYAFADRTVVAGLIPGCPAERFGLKVGDVLVRIDGESVVGRSQLYERLWLREPGDRIDFSVSREGGPKSLIVVGGDADEFFA